MAAPLNVSAVHRYQSFSNVVITNQIVSAAKENLKYQIDKLLKQPNCLSPYAWFLLSTILAEAIINTKKLDVVWGITLVAYSVLKGINLV